jgi:hypothetical protein
MKQRLYPVVKHGSRLAQIGAAWLLFCFAVGLIYTTGDIGRAQRGVMSVLWPAGGRGGVVVLATLVASSLLQTFCAGRIEYQIRRRRLRLAADQTAPKLQADASAPLLSAAKLLTDGADGRGAG